LSKVILFGERSLRRALSDYVDHFHAERNHQGKAMFCCFLGIRTATARACAVRERLVGSCAITIERRLMARRPFQFFDGVERPAASGI